ncbi:MAG: peptidyl-prolyl cis-trans isomerase [Bacteroidia bacterium]|jgi:peptidyl-prolyl cis-trans isomerase D|nr:peptidyl-prolyl cis-trans isomerase [Bacteroidia bacterium]GIV22870.1 MAG: peptidylprolyl isomerase [Bacteroidia bacterium]
MAGVIQKIRDKAGLAVLLIGVSLLLFILTDLLQSNAFIQETLFGRSDVVAHIGDEEVRYASYNALYERALRNQQVNDPLAEEQIKNAVWQQLLSDKLYEIETQKLSIGVSPEELYEMFVSDQPHPLVMQVFTQGDQVYDKNRVQQILAQAPNNPEIAAQLREFEDYLVQVRLREKYDALLKAAAYVPAPLVAYQNQLDNTNLSFAYLAVSYSAVADSLVPLSEGDIRSYYNEHKEEHRLREPERILRYAVVFKEPSAEDSAQTYRRVAELKELFQKATDDSLFAAANSDAPINFSFVRWPDLPAEIRDSVKQAGQVIGPYFTGTAYALAKVNAIVPDSQPVYRLRHIMIAKGLDSVAARKRADSLLRVLKPEKFAEAANQFSDDWQSKFSSGELGWYSAEGRFGKAFYEALAKAPVGRLYGIIVSDQGYHIVEVQEKEARRVRLAVIEKEIFPSSATLSALRQKAQQLARQAQANFDDAAQKMGINLRISPAIRPSAATIPALIGARDLIQWAFAHKKGDFSGVIETQNAFVIAQILSAEEPPYRSWESIRDQIEPKARNQKKAQYILQKLGNKGAASLEAMREAYGPGAYISRAEGALYSGVAVPGIGVEPKVLGTAAGLSPNTLSTPIEGNNGIYVLQLSEKKVPELITGATARSFSASQSSVQANLFSGRFIEAQKERLEVEDYRYKFGF